jgi:protein-L-isoaspartate(D-aspartate) O-methyltransferase
MPMLFTAEFRRKMAELPQRDRQDWLGALAERARRTAPDAPGLDALAQELREVARACRLELVAAIEKQLGPFDPRHLSAVLEVPRERFVRSEDVEHSAEDVPLPLDDLGLATISAPHAYLLSFRLLELAPGDALLELGSGTGYGAALAAYIVGSDGWIVTVEIDPELAARARATLALERNVAVVEGDAMSTGALSRRARKMVATFAVDELPGAWLDAIPEGGALVAPVGPRDRDQRLVRVVRDGGRLRVTEHGAVRYVTNRSSFGR